MLSAARMGTHSNRAYFAKEALVNLLGWSTEYMVTHVGLITANPLWYRAVNTFTETYLLSPLALIGRGTIWLGRGLVVLANPSNDPVDMGPVMREASIEFVTMLAVDAFYFTGSRFTGHHELLVEKTLVDTVVSSVVSQLLLAAARAHPPVQWPFWHRSQPVAAPALSQAHEGTGLLAQFAPI